MGRKAADKPTPGPKPHEVLKALIADREPGLTNAELARRTGMTRANVSRVMSGETPYPSLQTVEAILSAVKANLCHYHRAKIRIENNTD